MSRVHTRMQCVCRIHWCKIIDIKFGGTCLSGGEHPLPSVMVPIPAVLVSQAKHLCERSWLFTELSTERILWNLWCDVALTPVQTLPQNCLVSRNNLFLISPLQKLDQGEKCNIITKAKLSFYAIQYPHIHKCISHTLLLKLIAIIVTTTVIMCK